MTVDLIDQLPPVAEVREWAAELSARRGDASFSDMIYRDGLRIECGILDGRPKLVRENVGSPVEGGINIALRIQMATYPDFDFAEPFWNEPQRKVFDIPLQSQGKFSPHRHNEIHLPYPQVQPVLARVEEWHQYCAELGEGNIVTVSYTLYELDPEFQRLRAATKLARAVPAPR